MTETLINTQYLTFGEIGSGEAWLNLLKNLPLIFLAIVLVASVNLVLYQLWVRLPNGTALCNALVLRGDGDVKVLETSCEDATQDAGLRRALASPTLWKTVIGRSDSGEGQINLSGKLITIKWSILWKKEYRALTLFGSLAIIATASLLITGAGYVIMNHRKFEVD